MQVTAKLRRLRIAPRKIRFIADLLRGKSVPEAQAILNFTVKKGAQPLLKLLNSAVSSAKNSFQLDSANLYISKITADEGSKLKRWRARARGSANEIQKKTSHINLVLDEIVKSKKIKKAEKKAVTAEPGPLTPGVEAAPHKQERPKSKIEIKKPVVLRAAKKIFKRQVF